MGTLRQILDQMDIRGPVMLWILSAHLYAVLMPLVLIFAAVRHQEYLRQVTDYPGLFYVAVGLLCASGAFEVAQNTADRWYLTPETASANGKGLCDFLFYWFATAGQGALLIGLGGASGWVSSLGIAAVLAFPLFYLTRTGPFAPLSVVGLLVMWLGYRRFGDPVIFLQLLSIAATLYFFAALLRTGSQALHGFTTAVSASGLWFLALAIANGASGTPFEWATVAGLALATALLGVAAWPQLLRLGPTPRPGARERPAGAADRSAL